jgi:cell fate regulator YaaT (PSP1 superfamily)
VATVTGVRFRQAGKIYFFNPLDNVIQDGVKVIVETMRGVEIGQAVIGMKEVDDSEIVSPLRNVIRIAHENDIKQEEQNRNRENEARVVFDEKVFEHKLDMKLVDVELTFDLTKVIFYFTADERVDFRELVKDLASAFRMRIELRQIGVRDEAKILNGIGNCGRTLCCATFLDDFQPVSIKMAKDQNLSLNPVKISGVCGRLMCCLKYEEETYECLNRNLPGVGDIIRTPDGDGEVLSVSVLRQTVRTAVRRKENDPVTIAYYPVSDIKTVYRKPRDTDDERYSDF